MVRIPKALWVKFDKLLGAVGVPVGAHGAYRKWLRYYLDFCHKYEHAYSDAASLPHFMDKLASKGQTESQRARAEQAVQLYYRMLAGSGSGDGDVGLEVREQGAEPSIAGSVGARTPWTAPAAEAGSRNRGGTGASWKDEFAGLTSAIKMRHYRCDYRGA